MEANSGVRTAIKLQVILYIINNNILLISGGLVDQWKFNLSKSYRCIDSASLKVKLLYTKNDSGMKLR